jgi:UDP-2,4-diacetamido-2,4,6-trideoxy-beta-L-altropyranose hydrolase
MNVAFRVDSSRSMGAGHLMRCLTLADTLAQHGATVHFLCRDLPGNFAALVVGRGHRLHGLAQPTSTAAVVTGDNDYTRWLGVPAATDSEETAAVLDGMEQGMDWLIVDHYALDEHWERALRPAARRILVIDDLADRRHDADVLLDQTLGRKPDDYVARAPSSCRLLLGPAYALLRDAFAGLRPTALARRTDVTRAQRLLVSMGGVDSANLSTAVLDAVAMAGIAVEVDIVLGRNDPSETQVRRRAAGSAVPVQVHVGTDRMAELMCDVDLAVGAGGTTSWERCCLGLPTIVIVTAANQERIAAELARAGAIQLLGRADTVTVAQIADALTTLASDGKRLGAMSAQAAAVCDGHGAQRVAEVLLP